jgi:KDO2-lipid IV(A) lauroyltransferase
MERLRPESLYQRFLAFRERLGMEAVPLTGPGAGFRQLVEAVRANRIVPLLADRDLTGHGVEVSLFGEAARLPAGPAALALASGAPLVPATLSYDGPYLDVVFHPPIAVPESGTRAQRTVAMTQALAHVFEAGIGAHPVDWHMLQPVWVADRAGPGPAERAEEPPPSGPPAGQR